MHSTSKKIRQYNETITVTPEAGMFVQPDNWGGGNKLATCEEWDAADFRLDSWNYTDVSFGVNIEITGRTIQWERTWWQRRVRVRIEFVGDGEPSTFSGGWLWIDNK
jgi:hypothetical protein